MSHVRFGAILIGIILGMMILGSFIDRTAYMRGQCDAIAGKYYYMAVYKPDGNGEWIKLEMPTTQPIFERPAP